MGRFLAFILGIAGAVAGSQAPGFTLQYMQNLQGRVDELTTIVEQYDENIAGYGYTRETAMAECRTATDLLDAMCDGYETSVDRLEWLSGHLAELEAAGDYVRPLILARSYDKPIFTSVRTQFEPAVPVTIHGAAYAGGGFAVLWGAASFLFGILGAMLGGGRRYA
ncbi:MAG: hypothetical protein DHS20C05_11150 [Hyphococcus sp.]|nr:MAG: hypothetical protein DHS20C05_11150 [Marinicaulis sp.]